MFTVKQNRRMPIDAGMVKKAWRIKVARALVRNQLEHARASWAFTVVYLLYPSTSAAILDTFYCRQVRGQAGPPALCVCETTAL